MKKLIFIFIILLFASCSGDKNRGYGYNTKTEITVTDTTNKKKSFWERAAENQDAKRMTLYNKYGGVEDWDEVRAYKGQFDEHTFYVFISSEGLVVIPEALCK